MHQHVLKFPFRKFVGYMTLKMVDATAEDTTVEDTTVKLYEKDEEYGGTYDSHITIDTTADPHTSQIVNLDN